MNEQAGKVIHAMEVSPKRRWSLTLHDDRVHFAMEDARDASFNVLRSEWRKRVMLFDGLLLNRLIQVRTDAGRCSLKLEPAEFDALKAWLGPPTTNDLEQALRRRLPWCVPIGILYVIGSLPMAGDPDTGLPAIEMDPLGIVLGGTLLLLGVASRFHTSRIFFLLDSIWFLALAAHIAYRVLSRGGQPSWTWLLILLVVPAIIAGLRNYGRFERVNNNAN